MKKTVALGLSAFEDIIKRNVFYIDKTQFISEWWKSEDQVTLITRPRRFGKTLTLSMVETFFSDKYRQRMDLFEGFMIRQDEALCRMQGTYPVICLSLAGVKAQSYNSMLVIIKMLIAELYEKHAYLLQSDALSSDEKSLFSYIKSLKAEPEQYMNAVRFLANCMYKYSGKKVIILIDEYDTPMLEAYTAGYWEDAVLFIRRLFHAALKDNPYLERGLLTGITRITQESVFSDLNNLNVVTTTTEGYEDCFGFTEQEVFAALDQYELSEKKQEVRKWYDGFQFGIRKDIYNPWSIINFLRYKKFKSYWMNTSSNALIGMLVRQGSLQVKKEFQILLNGETVLTEIDEFITYADLRTDSKTIWSWLLTTGYVKLVKECGSKYEIALTNYEVKTAIYQLVGRWFSDCYSEYTGFIRMLLEGNLEGMQRYMSRVTLETFSYFDTGSNASESEKTEQFYHGFTIGLLADLNETHLVRSNRESGFGRYDVCIEPIEKNQDGILIEFKVFDPKKEKDLEETAQRALKQIQEKSYETELRSRGIKNVRSYGFAFRGKEVLIYSEE